MEFADILKGAASEGKEKHVPTIEIVTGHGSDNGEMVRVLVGKETPHPNTLEHHIAWAALLGIKPEGQVVNLGRAEFAPGFTSPDAVFHVPVGQFKAFAAMSYCNIHGLWQNAIDV